MSSGSPGLYSHSWKGKSHPIQGAVAKRTKKTNSAANIGFEAQLWAAADALRNNMDAAQYKHVVLRLIVHK